MEHREEQAQNFIFLIYFSIEQRVHVNLYFKLNKINS